MESEAEITCCDFALNVGVSRGTHPEFHMAVRSVRSVILVSVKFSAMDPNDNDENGQST